MNFDLLTNNLPVSVRVSGKEYPISWDFRTGIKLDGILRSEMEEADKLEQMLHLYYGQDHVPPDIPQAIEQIIWFYRCGEMPDDEEEEKKKRR